MAGRTGAALRSAKGFAVMSKLLDNFWANEQGATAIEYGLIASLLSIAAISSFTTVGTKLSRTFNFVASQLHS
jgi:pilus assembly protein Flp/PilA